MTKAEKDLYGQVKKYLIKEKGCIADYTGTELYLKIGKDKILADVFGISNDAKKSIFLCEGKKEIENRSFGKVVGEAIEDQLYGDYVYVFGPPGGFEKDENVHIEKCKSLGIGILLVDPSTNEVQEYVRPKRNPVKSSIKKETMLRIYIKDRHLFSISIDFKEDIQRGNISGELRNIFEIKKYPLSDKTKLDEIKEGQWKIVNRNETYIFKSDDKRLNIFEKIKPISNLIFQGAYELITTNRDVSQELPCIRYCDVYQSIFKDEKTKELFRKIISKGHKPHTLIDRDVREAFQRRYGKSDLVEIERADDILKDFIHFRDEGLERGRPPILLSAINEE